MQRTLALRIEERALDEIAVLNRDIDMFNLLIAYHSDSPPMVRWLSEQRRLLKEQKERAQQRRDYASQFINR